MPHGWPAEVAPADLERCGRQPAFRQWVEKLACLRQEWFLGPRRTLTGSVHRWQEQCSTVSSCRFPFLLRDEISSVQREASLSKVYGRGSRSTSVEERVEQRICAEAREGREREIPRRIT